MGKKIKLSSLCLLLVSLFFPVIVMAEDASVILQFEQQIKTITDGWITPLKAIAKYLLFTLGTISLGWTFITMMIKGADLPDILFELVRFILFFGFFFAVIENTDTWPKAIINGFVESANRVSAASNAVASTAPITSVSPAQIMERGFVMSNAIMDANEGWFFDNLAFFLVSIIVVIIYAIVSAMVMLTIVEMYIVITGGILVLGFAGTPWTSDYAKKYLIYIVSVGMKMFMTMMVVGLSESFISSWVAAGDRSLDEGGSLLAIVAILILFVYLVVKIPDFVQSLITGASLGGNASSVAAGMGAAKTSGAAAMGAAGSVARGGASVVNAGRLAQAQQSSGTGGGGAMGTAKNLGAAALQTAGQRLQGKDANGGPSGHSKKGAQVSDNLKNKMAELNKSDGDGNEASQGNISGGPSSSYKSPAGE